MRHRHDRDVHAGERADLARVHPAGVRPRSRSRSRPGRSRRRATRPRSTSIPVTRVTCRDLGAAPPGALGQRERQLARVDVAVGRQVRGAEHAVGRHRRETAPAPRPPRSARAAGRTSSPSRPAARSPPSARARTRGAASRPPASPSRARPRPRARGTARRCPSSSASAASEPRSWPTSPAEWNVEPLVRSARSTSTTSSQPSRASQYRIEQPPTPPPMTTARARSRMAVTLEVDRH